MLNIIINMRTETFRKELFFSTFSIRLDYGSLQHNDGKWYSYIGQGYPTEDTMDLRGKLPDAWQRSKKYFCKAGQAICMIGGMERPRMRSMAVGVVTANVYRDGEDGDNYCTHASRNLTIHREELSRYQSTYSPMNHFIRMVKMVKSPTKTIATTIKPVYLPKIGYSSSLFAPCGG